MPKIHTLNGYCVTHADFFMTATKFWSVRKTCGSRTPTKVNILLPLAQVGSYGLNLRAVVLGRRAFTGMLDLFEQLRGPVRLSAFPDLALLG